jgi:signal transduction histidine kinase
LNISACAIDIKRMLSNLLNNSIEACRDFPIINLGLSADNDRLNLSITDNGIGMPLDKVESYLMGESTKHGKKGLGLSGAKITMESLGGKIYISSQKRIGATVELVFPVSQR